MQKCYNGALVWPCQNVVLKRRGAFATEDTEQSRIHLPWQSLAKGGAKVQELVYSASHEWALDPDTRRVCEAS